MGTHPLCLYCDRHGSGTGTTGVSLARQPRTGSPQAEIHCDRVRGAGWLPNLSSQPDAPASSLAGASSISWKHRDSHGALSDCLRVGTNPPAGSLRQYLCLATGPLRLGYVHCHRVVLISGGGDRRMASPDKSAVGARPQRGRGVRSSGRAGGPGLLKNDTCRHPTRDHQEFLSIEIRLSRAVVTSNRGL